MFDSYSGSGVIPINYFKKYGKILGETFLKEIISFSKDSLENCLNEELVIADKYKYPSAYLIVDAIDQSF